LVQLGGDLHDFAPDDVAGSHCGTLMSCHSGRHGTGLTGGYSTRSIGCRESCQVCCRRSPRRHDPRVGKKQQPGKQCQDCKPQC
jgi:hypothetical protein